MAGGAHAVSASVTVTSLLLVLLTPPHTLNRRQKSHLLRGWPALFGFAACRWLQTDSRPSTSFLACHAPCICPLQCERRDDARSSVQLQLEVQMPSAYMLHNWERALPLSYLKARAPPPAVCAARAGRPASSRMREAAQISAHIHACHGHFLHAGARLCHVCRLVHPVRVLAAVFHGSPFSSFQWSVDGPAALLSTQRCLVLACALLCHFLLAQSESTKGRWSQ